MGMWNLMNLDNLAVHCATEAKHPHRERKVPLSYLLEYITECEQATYAVNDSSTRRGAYQSLDKCLMVESNMEKWESIMKSGEGRVLTDNLVSVENDEAVKIIYCVFLVSLAQAH